MTLTIRDTLERLWWTFVAAATGNITAVALLDIAAWKMAVATGLVAAVNLVTIIARWRLSVLPDPGAGLPGLPVVKPRKRAPAKKAAKKAPARPG